MALKKFLVPPEQSKYTVTDGEETVAAKLDGGASRYRSDILNATSKVTVTWTFTRSQFEYFRAFYKGSTVSGALPFLIDLVLDEAFALTEHQANFIPKKVRTSRVRGHSYQVTADLEVKPFAYADGYYDAIVFLYEEFGDDAAGAASLFNQLEQFVNVDLPSTPVFVP